MLYSLPNAKDLSQNIIKWVKEIGCKSENKYSMTNGKPQRIELDEKTLGILLFINGEFEDVYCESLKDKKALGWSSSYKGAIVPLYLLMLEPNVILSNLQKSVLRDYVYKYSHGLDEKYYKIIEKCFCIWKEQWHLSDADYKKYHKWCTDEVDKRVIAIVSKTFRNAYARVARLVVLLDEIGKDKKKGEVIKKYQQMFPRHRAFKDEIKRLMDSK